MEPGIYGAVGLVVGWLLTQLTEMLRRRWGKEDRLTEWLRTERLKAYADVISAYNRAVRAFLLEANVSASAEAHTSVIEFYAATGVVSILGPEEVGAAARRLTSLTADGLDDDSEKHLDAMGKALDDFKNAARKAIEQ